MPDKLQTLLDRLDENLATAEAAWGDKSKAELIASAREITAINDTHYYLTESHGFDPEELDYLLLFENPLQVVADKWQARTEDLSDFSFALDEVFNKREALRDHALKEKPSVLEKLHAPTNLAERPHAPSKDREVR